MSSLADKKSGYVFNIQHYSVHDGPGIRTIVFLKGCPLRCQWCSNPESQQYYPELAYNRNKCIGTAECFRCKGVCEAGAITAADGKISINREVCTRCFRCVEACPSNALHVFGKVMSVGEVLDVVEADSMFYARSGGGLTLSGGEPLTQIDFVLAILQEAKRRRIDATIETCGFVEWENLRRAGEYLKTILYDIKSVDPVKHEQFTGVSNELILQNFLNLREAFPNLQIVVRTPLVPGFNDSEAEIGAILDFIKGLPNVEYELLPYHRMGQQKYEFLDREYSLTDVKLAEETAQALKEFAQANR